MPENQPTPPSDLPDDVVDTLNDSSLKRLRQIAEYAEELAEYRSREPHIGEDGDDDDIHEPAEERPEGVPSRATVTIKEINDNRYYYWQWRDGENVRSQYKGPVTPE